MNRIFSFIIVLFLFSCKNAEVTETEVDAVQQVLNFYNGECHRHKGFATENGDNKKFFKLEMSKSKLLESDSSKLKAHSGNIAYLFFSNLKDEKSNYDEIRVKINLINGESQEFDYSSEELKEIEELKLKTEKLTKLILDKNFESLASEFDPNLKIKKENIANLFGELENRLGKLSKTQFQGFQYEQTNNFGNVIVISEALVFEKINATMLLIFGKENKNLISIEIP